jgi:hypothetical protein
VASLGFLLASSLAMGLASLVEPTGRQDRPARVSTPFFVDRPASCAALCAKVGCQVL